MSRNSIPSNSPAARPRFALIAIIVGTYFNDLVSLSLQGPFAYDNISVFVCLCRVQWFEYVFGHIEFMMCWTAIYSGLKLNLQVFCFLVLSRMCYAVTFF